MGGNPPFKETPKYRDAPFKRFYFFHNTVGIPNGFIRFFFSRKISERFMQVRNADSFVAAQCGESLGWTADVEESLMTLTGFSLGERLGFFEGRILTKAARKFKEGAKIGIKRIWKMEEIIL